MNRMFVVIAFAASSSVASAQGAAPAPRLALTVTLSEWTVRLERDTVPAGPVTFTVKNAGTMAHGFYVRGEGVDKGTKEIPAGQEGRLLATLKPGTYEVFCPMSDLSHKTAGMVKTLVVTAATKKP